MQAYGIAARTGSQPGFHACLDRSDTWQRPQLLDGRAVQIEVELMSLQADSTSAGIVRGLAQHVLSVHVPLWCRGGDPFGGSLSAHVIADASLLTLRSFPDGRLQPRCNGHAGSSSLSLESASSQLDVPFFCLTMVRSATSCSSCRRSYRVRLGAPAVHPHARGDLRERRSASIAASGPPPRAWGPARSSCQRGRSARSTPTRVGTWRHEVLIHQSVAVHPHARGDLRRPAISLTRSDGPPPRAWGPVLVELPGVLIVRSTPTRVGTCGCRARR